MKLSSLWPFSRKSATLADIIAEMPSLGASKSGQSVNVASALRVAAVLSCVRVIAEGCAQVPLKLLRVDGKNKLEAIDHPLWDILHRKPNDITTSFALRETLIIHAALTGNGYAFISRNSVGKVLELINIPPGAVTLEESKTMGEPPRYKLTGKDGSAATLTTREILHLRGPSWDGIVGMDVIRQAREAIGLAMATEAAHARLHSNGARPGGLLSVEGTLNDEQFKRLRKWIADNYQGSDNAYETMILDRSSKWLPMAMSGVDAQHLETRRFQIEEVCRIMRVLPVMVGIQDKSSTYAGAEQNFLAHVVHTLGPWFERLEQTMDVQLLTDAERQAGYYTKLEEKGLLRGALKDTAEYLYKLCGLGIMSRNEAREMLDLNPKEGLDEPLTPINLSADLAGNQKEKTNA